MVEAREIDDLQDADPKRFRTKGLRNLAKVVCGVIRDYGAANCAINATGGYKAQIAIAVLMGQALGVPVYYKHERFDEIIAFPPCRWRSTSRSGCGSAACSSTLEREPRPHDEPRRRSERCRDAREPGERSRD